MVLYVWVQGEEGLVGWPVYENRIIFPSSEMKESLLHSLGLVWLGFRVGSSALLAGLN